MTYLAIFPTMYFRHIKETVERRGKTEIVPVKVLFFIFWYEFVGCHWL